MKKRHLAGLALIVVSFSAMAAEGGIFYAAAGASRGGGNYSLGAGTDVDVLEFSAINLGPVTGDNSSATFRGLSLVQNSTPSKDFSLMFRLGFGKTTTTFANGATASRIGFSKGVILGAGGQYQVNRHLALRAEVNRLTYTASPDGLASGITWPLSFSALFIF